MAKPSADASLTISAMELPADFIELAAELNISYGEVMPGEFRLAFASKKDMSAFVSRLKMQEWQTCASVLFPSRQDILRRESGGICTDEDVAAILQVQGYQCYFTGEALASDPSGYQIEHLTPISRGGASWPLNIALTTKLANLQKTYTTRAEFFRWLEKKRGSEWASERARICKEIDIERRKIDTARKAAVRRRLVEIRNEVFAYFPNCRVELELVADEVTFTINDVSIKYPRGFLRTRRALDSARHYLEVASTITGKAPRPVRVFLG